MSALPLPQQAQRHDGLPLTARQKAARERNEEKLYGPRNSPLAANYSIADLWAEFPEARKEWKALLREEGVPRTSLAYTHALGDSPEVVASWKKWAKEKKERLKKA